MSNLHREIISYLLSELGCSHPYHVSRILLLAEWTAEERLGRRLTSLTYHCEPYGFYIEELKPIIQSLEESGCIRRREEKKCMEYVCDKPKLPEDVERILREVLEKVRGLNDVELNRLVIHDPRYRKMLGEMS